MYKFGEIVYCVIVVDKDHVKPERYMNKIHVDAIKDFMDSDFESELKSRDLEYVVIEEFENGNCELEIFGSVDRLTDFVERFYPDVDVKSAEC